MTDLNVTTTQDAFNAIVRHAATMKRQAHGTTFGHTACLYDTPEGGCFVGCLIVDRDLARRLDGMADSGIEFLVDDGEVEVGAVNVNFLVDMQSIHDSDSSWDREGLKTRAWDDIRTMGADYGLDVTIIDTVLGTV